MTIIETRALAKSFGDVRVLRSLDFTVAEGEFVAVTGRSGSGKSTLLRLIARLERPTSGAIVSDDRIAVAFQEPRLVPWLSVEDNVTLGLGLNKAARIAVASAALADVQIPDKIKAWPLALSGGQAQRVSLARALVHSPRLLLLDEPVGALDAITRAEMQDLVLDLRREHGFAVVLVTHDVAEAVRMADRVVMLADGAISHETAIRRDATGPDGAPLAAEDYRAELAAALV
jgi:sulfonate transport system ATP-binding protein